MSAYTRLVVLAPKGLPLSELVPKLQAAFDGGPIDAVVLPLPQTDERARINYAKAVAEIVQNRQSVLLLEDDVDIIPRSGADGIHASNPKGLDLALDRDPKHERMMGVGGIRTRHEAMEIAEAGADYVMFGEPRPDGYIPPLETTLDAAGWWAELFNTPGIGFVAEIGDVGAMASTGIEFVALGNSVFDYPDGPSMAIRSAHELISHAPAPPWAEQDNPGRKGR